MFFNTLTNNVYLYRNIRAEHLAVKGTALDGQRHPDYLSDKNRNAVMRTSPVHYIAPSSISITPNANGSADDLAVYVARSTRIKVYSRGSLQTQDATYQQWKLSGRNRRLAESDVPYTIYARLPKGDKDSGYLVFAPKQLTVSGWLDKYPYLTLDGLATGTAGRDTGSNWYVRLGEVSLPENGSRTVTLDTGILGTDQFNAEWNLDPDDAPLRVSIRCTIDGEDAGQTPYVPWERKLLLQATLVEGWDTGAASRLDHWTIARNTDDASLDPGWPDEERRRTFADTGEIVLSHLRGPADDFNQAVSASYLVTAWGTTEDDPDGEVVALAYTTVSIMAETVEKYDLEVSTSLVTYSQASGTYRPAGGVMVGIRATDQKGNATKVTRGQLVTAGLQVSYSHQDEEDWTPLVFDNPVEDPAEAVIPTDAFSEKKSIVIRLTNMSGMELSLFTVAFIIETDNASELYLSRLHDDKAHGFIGFLKGVWFGVKNWFIDENGNAYFHNLTVAGVLDAVKGYIDDLRSHNYQSGLLDGAGFRLTNDNGEGSSELEVDFLKVRKKATFMELEVREETFVGGNQHYSPAGSILYRVEYLDMNDQMLGYSVMKVPFLLKRFAFLGRVFNYAARKRVRRKMSDEEWKQCHHFRCYLLADDGTTATRNWWKVGDQPRCQTFNKAISAQNKRDNLYNWKKDHFSDDPSTPMPDKTIIEGPFETAYYWRLVSNVGSERLDDGNAYDFIDMPYEGWDVTIGGVHYHYTDDEKRSFRDGGSGIPVAGDTIVCMGSRTEQDRMNMISLYTSGQDNNPPAIKGYRGIHTFNINPENKVFEISPNEFLIRSRMFKLLDDSGYEFPVPLERGEWKQGVRYHWYDRVSWKGSIWLCQVVDDYLWEDAAGNNYEEWRVEDVDYGEGEFSYAADKTDHYYRTGHVGGVTVYYIRIYTYSEPDRNNDLWMREVSKGTEIIRVETSYAASKSGTEHPADSSSDWKVVGTGSGQYANPDTAIAATGIDDPEHKSGIYLWTRTRTFYDDINDPDRPPTVEYSVNRWGIDADGIYQINSYYLARLSETPIDASSDTFPMPGSAAWEKAAANAKWFDAFSVCASANGGVGQMQGWLVWEKTVIIYDQHFDKDGNEDTKPDIITYKSSRIGQDGQIGMEEYYMLAESDDFKTVFGSLTPSYKQIGIRWYNQSDPAAENWRLSSTTPNINPSMWKAVMPAYDESQPKKKYLWNFEQRVDGQGTEYATKPICIGNHARGIKGVIELYALSSSQTPISADRPIPADINSKNTWGVIPTTGFQDPQVWGDEKYDRAPTEALPYQWNWTRTLYSAADASGLTYEDHYHVSAVRGTKGEDGSGIEYIYKLTSSADAPATPTGEDRDDFVPSGWTDNPQGVSFQNQYEWVCERKSSATPSEGGYSGGHTWGPFSAPKLWSKWGKNGQDGDGVEYVYIRTASNTAPTITDSSDTYGGKTYLDDDYLPLSSAGRCTDDPKGTSHDLPFEWVIKRTKGSPNAETGVRQWEKYSGTMALWATFSESVVRLDISNEMDMIPTTAALRIDVARTVETTVRL